VNRAVRFSRANAALYRVDPMQPGVTGSSEGGHLSLLLITRGGPGNAKYNGWRTGERDTIASTDHGLIVPTSARIAA